jgi:hypothetical protein
MSKARQLADLGNVYDDGALSNRNLLINSAMQVAQRGTSSSSAGYQTVDRFRFTSDDMDQLAFTQTQDTTGPSGFTNSYKLTVTTPETTTEAEEQLFMFQAIEAQNLQQLGYGTAEAKQLTLSFWVKSSVTGAYCVAFYQNDGNRLITSTYSISSANTWEYKTITIDGDTSGTINNDNGAGLELYFFLSVGPDRKTTDSTSWGAWTAAKFGYGQVADVAATSSATWQITGAQLEIGDTSTPFEHIPYSDQLARCQRYYQTIKAASGSGYRRFARGHVVGSSLLDCSISLPVEMRTFPTLVTTGVAGDYAIYHENTVTACNTTPELNTASDDGVGTVISMNAFVSSGLTVGQGAALLSNNLSTSFLAFSAEL